MKKIFRKYIDSFRYAYEGTEKSLEYCLLICIATVLSLCATDITDSLPVKAGLFTGAFIVITLLFILIRKLVSFIFSLVKKEYLYNDILHILVYGTVLYFLSCEYYNVEFRYLPIIAFATAFVMIKFSKSLYALLWLKRKSIRLYITFALAAIGSVVILVFVAGEGFKDNYPALKKLYSEKGSQGTMTEDKTGFDSESGSLKVGVVDYGTDEALLSGTADLSFFAGYSKKAEFVREKIFKHDLAAAELKGRAWYPEDGGNYPVMFIVHGNHMMTTESHLGYDYLGEYLASYGYVVVSVDETMLNGFVNGGVHGENDARAVLLLENMKQLQGFNSDADCVLYGKMDFENICLAGHSRGGEAVAIAMLFNEYEAYPDNSNVKFFYNFNIKSLIAIAPVCDQYMPGGQDLELEDISYLLVHGSNDQDVSVMAGEKQYENIVFTGEEDCFKASLYIAGANHGQFNSRWGRYDKTFPDRLLLNTANLLKEDEQQEILKVSVKKFLDATIGAYENREGSREFFIDCKSAGLPEAIYIQTYEESGSLMIADFEEDSDTLTGTLEDSELVAGGVSLYGGITLDFSVGNADRDNSSLRLMWYESEDNTPDLQIEMEDAIEITEFLSFDFSDLDEEAAFGEIYEQHDIKVDLYDSRYNKVTASVSECAKLFPAIPVRQFKLQYLTGTYDVKKRFQTVYVPTEAFSEGDEDFDFENVVKIIFRFDGSRRGNVAVDNIIKK